ncbi:hypothetical protein [Streptomyces prunicolor]|uniref:hypothetical protein n=1 Tax=Streptomyces prunicolor TaxID=67348 RepID=UPI0003670637|nr:hypothetical protein [Streptomyces prunicolor]
MTSKKVDALVAKLRGQGAEVIKRGSRWRVTEPGKPLAWLPTSDPAGQGLDNKLADLRRKGYRI